MKRAVAGLLWGSLVSLVAAGVLVILDRRRRPSGRRAWSPKA